MDTSTLIAELLVYVENGVPASGAYNALCARITHALVAHEVRPGGPYACKTGAQKGMCDLGLNLAAAQFLRLHDISLPHLSAFIDAELRRGTATSSVVPAAVLEKLTHAYCARQHRAPSVAGGTEPVYTPHEARIMEAIRRHAHKRFAVLERHLARNAAFLMERTIKGNPDKQMSLMPFYLRTALGSRGDRFSDEQVAALGFANICFWSAFIVYDDFWDEDEAADTHLLPVANLFARHYSSFFAALLPKESGFPNFFHTLMDALDAANAWEMQHCRMRRNGSAAILPDTLPAYGDFSIKFYPAAGHVFGPVAMLVMAGYDTKSAEVAHLINYFKHYLVAMQLNDDAHDWKEDMARGHISTAVSLLLERWQQRHGKKQTIDSVRDKQELELLFWFEVLVPLSQAVYTHSAQSKEALSSLRSVVFPQPLLQFITRNKRIADNARAAHQQSSAFIETFARSS